MKMEGGPPCPPLRVTGGGGLPDRSFSKGWRSALQTLATDPYS